MSKILKNIDYINNTIKRTISKRQYKKREKTEDQDMSTILQMYNGPNRKIVPKIQYPDHIQTTHNIKEIARNLKKLSPTGKSRCIEHIMWRLPKLICRLNQ